MSKYKRLTERYIDEQGTNCVRKLAWDGEILHRLAELEDKIENGTLIELPCKVGDKVYHLSCKTISEEIVSQIKYTICNGEIDLSNSHIMTDDLYDKDYNFYRVSKLGKSLFLTKVEAEAKLKELQQKS